MLSQRTGTEILQWWLMQPHNQSRTKPRSRVCPESDLAPMMGKVQPWFWGRPHSNCLHLNAWVFGFFCAITVTGYNIPRTNFRNIEQLLTSESHEKTPLRNLDSYRDGKWNCQTVWKKGNFGSVKKVLLRSQKELLIHDTHSWNTQSCFSTASLSCQSAQTDCGFPLPASNYEQIHRSEKKLSKSDCQDL